jgi:ribosome-binding factor A
LIGLLFSPREPEFAAVSQRTVRVNELIKREISDILHTRYQAETVAVTVVDVDTSPNLRSARVYYSVLGDAGVSHEAATFFKRYGAEIRRQLSQRIILKYLPRLEFREDEALQRGAHLNQILDTLEIPEPEADPDVSEKS